MFATLKTLVLKTATVAGVKLAAPADRIGLGFGVAYPADNLSPNPAPEQVRPRAELSQTQMPWQLRSDGDAVPPVRSAGCLGAPGASASRSGSHNPSLTSWRTTTRTAATARTLAGLASAAHGRDHLPGDPRRLDRSGRDCQSPRRLSDTGFVVPRTTEPTGFVVHSTTEPKRVAIREVVSAATAGK